MTKRRWIPLLAGLAVLIAAPTTGVAQATGPYVQAVAEHFEIPASEVGILSGWQIPAEEIPVVLFVAERGGASRDALVALRRRGAAWATIAGRYSLDAGAFHVPMAGTPAAGVLARVYGSYASVARAEWGSIALDDAAIVALVNLRFLSAHLSMDPGRIAAEMGQGGSAVDAFGRLAGDD